MTKTLRYLFLVALFMLLLSCQPEHITPGSPKPTVSISATIVSKEGSFQQILPIEEMNTRIQFWPMESNLKAGDCGQDLILQNVSHDRIVFPTDYGLRILIYTNGGWEEIPNLTRYVPPGNRQVSPKGPDSPGVIGILFCPDVTNIKLPAEIRAVIVGQTESTSGEESKEVAAYLDLVIEK